MKDSNATHRLRGLARRILSSDDDLEAEEMAQTTENAGAQTIDSVHARDYAHLYGEIVSVTLGPAGRALDFQADFFDGTGHVTLVWMGRNHIPGIEVGARIRVEGRVALLNQRMVIYNPVYAIEAPEEDEG